jgi:hypothetical protein
MSKGLGAAQRLVLTALASLEAEHGKDGLFYVWVIVDRAYAMSQPMQDRERAAAATHAEMTAGIRERAEQGDGNAALYLGLTQSLRRSKPSPRKRRTTPFWLTETRFNPSRVLATLERRGLVSRKAIQGGGSAGLTDEGRDLSALLSVGTTWRLANGADEPLDGMVASALGAGRGGDAEGP